MKETSLNKDLKLSLKDEVVHYDPQTLRILAEIAEMEDYERKHSGMY